MKIKKFVVIKYITDDVINDVLLVSSDNKMYKNINFIMSGELTEKIEIRRINKCWNLFFYDGIKFQNSYSIFREIRINQEDYLHLII